jgi:hypothetical protein
MRGVLAPSLLFLGTALSAAALARGRTVFDLALGRKMPLVEFFRVDYPKSV